MNSDKPKVIPVRDQIYEKLRDEILTNEYKPGDLVQIDKLARDLGVSATPIREALIRLENSGLLTLIPNKGAVVTEFTAEDVRNTWEMRKLLEPYAARCTAEMDIHLNWDEIEASINRILAGDFDIHQYIQVDNEIHKMLFENLNNSLLKETIQRIHHLSIRMRYFAESITENSEHVIKVVCNEHLKIIDALKKRDPEETEKAMLHHVNNSAQRTISSTAKKK